MKLRERVSMLMSIVNTHNINNAIRRATGKKPLPTLQIAGQSINQGPPGSGKSKTFKRNKRITMKSLTLQQVYSEKASALKKYKRTGITIRRNKAVQLAH